MFRPRTSARSVLPRMALVWGLACGAGEEDVEAPAASYPGAAPATALPNASGQNAPAGSGSVGSGSVGSGSVGSGSAGSGSVGSGSPGGVSSSGAVAPGAEARPGNPPLAARAAAGTGSGGPAAVGQGAAPSAGPAGMTVPAAASGSAGAAGSGAVPPAGVNGVPPPRGPAPSAAGPAEGCLLCDDFEAAPVGGSPDVARWSLTLDSNANAGPSPSISIDGTVAHGGSRSVRIQGNTNLREIVGEVPEHRIFVRAWMRLGNVPTGGGPVIMAVGGEQNNDLRLRLWAGELATLNTGNGDGIVPNAAASGNCPECVPVPANTWFCAEMFVDDQARSVTLWIDGREAASVVGNHWTSSWPNFPEHTSVRFGFWGLQGAAATDVWIDDVAVRAERVGCQ